MVGSFVSRLAMGEVDWYKYRPKATEMYEKSVLAQSMRDSEDNGMEECHFCERSKCVVKCDDCGRKILFARVRIVCKNHMKRLYTMDLTKCPDCKSDKIRETRKLVWYQDTSIDSSREESYDAQFPAEVSIVSEDKNEQAVDVIESKEVKPVPLLARMKEMILDEKVPTPMTSLSMTSVDTNRCDCVYMASSIVCEMCGHYGSDVIFAKECDVHTGKYSCGLKYCPGCCVASIKHIRSFEVVKCV